MTIIEARGRTSTPAWAVQQRHLIDHMNTAGATFAHHATRPDGTLRQYSAWPSHGGADNGYEAFLSFPLFYLLGGSTEVLDMGRLAWEGITWQYTNYGTLDREFPRAFDWFHHSESLTYLSYLALADPGHHVFRQRTMRFAHMYTGDDPAAPNWDADKRMIRGALNGSDGPNFHNSAVDWHWYRPHLTPYPAPFEDLPGLDPSDPMASVDWTNDAMYEQILTRMNERMMRGDIPLNLSAAMLVTQAYLHTGEDPYCQWVLDYLQAWSERCMENGGIVPDNVGPSGAPGELNAGKWWGGYYGWRWPHGARNIIEPALVAGSCALLMTGDRSHLDLCRSQLDLVWEQRREIDGCIMVPARHGDGGWFDYEPPSPHLYIHLHYLSQAEQDLARLNEVFPGRVGFEHLPPYWGLAKAGPCPPTAWLKFIEGENPQYPEAILASSFDNLCASLDRIDTDDADRESLHCSHYQHMNPVISEGMVQMALGTPAAVYNGGLLQSHLFYYDPQSQRPGLPEHVAALVHHVSDAGVRVELVNTDPVAGHKVLLQAGAFGEHQFDAADFPEEDQPRVALDGKHVVVSLGPASKRTVNLHMRRYVNRPSYDGPQFSS